MMRNAMRNAHGETLTHGPLQCPLPREAESIAGVCSTTSVSQGSAGSSIGGEMGNLAREGG